MGISVIQYDKKGKGILPFSEKCSGKFSATLTWADRSYYRTVIGDSTFHANIGVL